MIGSAAGKAAAGYHGKEDEISPFLFKRNRVNARRVSN
jgi:hypothetical protein